MPQEIDLLIYGASQIVTCASPSGPRRTSQMRTPEIIEGGAIAVQAGSILDIGSERELREKYISQESLDARGNSVCPGFVDAHTHVVYAGSRLDEFEQRIRGASYMDIMAAGGGIASTMRATRRASVEELIAQSRLRLDTMLAHGTTTVESKSGYGLDTESEMKLLSAMATLEESHPIELVPTFLGAHAVPPEMKGKTEDYVRLVIEEMIPAAAQFYQNSIFSQRGTPFFCDVFCEAGVFDLEQSAMVLEAGSSAGMQLKLHADEFQNLGGVRLAVGMGAVSVDHLDVTPGDEVEHLADSATVGVVLPAVNFNLGSREFADARALIDAGAALALSTDINPGSAPCPSLPLVMAIATRYQRMLPAEALHACTINAAFAVGLGEKIGSLERGKQADILVLNGADYRQCAYNLGSNPVACVIKAGRIVKPWSERPE